MTAVLLNTGRDLIANRFTQTQTVPIDSVRIGSLAPAQRYDATASPGGTRTLGLLDATPRILQTANITLLSNMGNVQIDVSDEMLTAVYDADEIAFMSGTTPVFLVAQASGPYFRKVANASALFSLNFTIAGNTVSNITISVPTFVFATQAQATARTAANVMMSPLRTAQAMAGTAVLPRELPAGANLDLFDNADHYGYWYRNGPSGLTNLPTGITAGQLILEVMQNGNVSFGVSRVVQRLTVATTESVRVFLRDSYDGEDRFNVWREMASIDEPVTYTADATIAKPFSAKMVYVELWEGGNGGGDGNGFWSTVDNRAENLGGVGGKSGNFAHGLLPASWFPASIALGVTGTGRRGLTARSPYGAYPVGYNVRRNSVLGIARYPTIATYDVHNYLTEIVNNTRGGRGGDGRTSGSAATPSAAGGVFPSPNLPMFGAAGASGAGGSGPSVNGGDGVDGTQPGGGGGGGGGGAAISSTSGSMAGSGGDGADGQIRLTWLR